MGEKEDKFDKYDEMGQLLGGYDVNLARKTALEHARENLPKEDSWLGNSPLAWEISDARFDEDADCYKVIVLCYPKGSEVETKAQWEYHIDATGNLYAGTPMLVSKGKWAVDLPKPVEEKRQHREEDQRRAGEEQYRLEEEKQQAVEKQRKEQKEIRRKEQQEAARKAAKEEKRQREEKRRTEALSPPIIEMVPIPGGTADLGSVEGAGQERPLHSVTLSSFFMAKYEVSYDKWKEVKVRAEAIGYTFITSGKAGGENYGHETHPVTNIEWNDTVLWCNALSEMEGRIPCYYTSSDKSTVYRSGRVDMQNSCVDWESDGYRLPTEAEWEYACRAGTVTKYSFGNKIGAKDANYGLRKYGTTAVGSYPANSMGLYDMHGNVFEWCWDLFGPRYYETAPSNNPKGPKEGSERVARGGFWYNSPIHLRSAFRNFHRPETASDAIGFRPVYRQ